MVHVYFSTDVGISHRNLYDPGLLDEYEKIYPGEEKKSVEVFVRTLLMVLVA